MCLTFAYININREGTKKNNLFKIIRFVGQ